MLYQEEESAGNINVVCRFRPLNAKEKEISNSVCVSFPSQNTVTINQHEGPPLSFTFDKVFPSASTQEEVYEFSAKSIVESVMKGFNGTVFAYGQTSSGKTYTMTGDLNSQAYMGITPRMISTVFDTIYSEAENIEFTVKVSFCEIYMEKISDLLDTTKDKLKVRESKNKGVYIADLSETYVTADFDVHELIRIGNTNRQVAESNMNAKSSRSHSIVGAFAAAGGAKLGNDRGIPSQTQDEFCLGSRTRHGQSG